MQLHLLSDVLDGSPSQSVYVRRVSCTRDVSFYKRLDTIHKAIYNRPYDLNIIDWLRALYHLDIYSDIKPSSTATTRSFWCSALIAYVFEELGLINPICWTEVVPRDFSLWSSRLEFRCKIGGEELIQ